MPRFKILSGDEVISILERFSFLVVSQSGNHVKLRRVNSSGNNETLIIPRHNELDRGTLRAIFRQASRYIKEEELRSYFYAL